MKAQLKLCARETRVRNMSEILFCRCIGQLPPKWKYLLGFHLTSRRPCWCHNNEKSLLGIWFYLILCKTWTTFCHCFVHQHGRLITWVGTKNLNASKLSDFFGKLQANFVHCCLFRFEILLWGRLLNIVHSLLPSCWLTAHLSLMCLWKKSPPIFPG